MNSLPFLLLALVMSVLISSLVIWLLGKLELGLVVERFGSAPIAGMLIGAVAGVVTVLFSLLGMQDSTGFFGGMLHFLVTFVVLIISDRLLPGINMGAPPWFRAQAPIRRLPCAPKRAVHGAQHLTTGSA